MHGCPILDLQVLCQPAGLTCLDSSRMQAVEPPKRPIQLSKMQHAELISAVQASGTGMAVFSLHIAVTFVKCHFKECVCLLIWSEIAVQN